MKLKKIANDISFNIKKHGPEILTGFGIVGIFTTCGTAIHDTVKAVRIFDKKKKKKKEDLTPFEVVESTWKCYIPTAISATATSACFLGANKIHLNRNAALAAAYSLSESRLIEYKDKVVETIGEKKEKKLRDDIAADQIKSNPPTNKEVYITTLGETLCYDPISGRYFMCTIEKLRSIVQKLNDEARGRYDLSVKLNRFYDEVGLPNIEMGEFLVWSISKDEDVGDFLNRRGPIFLEISSKLTEDERPCAVITFEEPPTYIYD